LIDEPTLGLDPYFARFIRQFIKHELHEKQKKTVLLTTHYMMEADELCDRVAFMNRGKIQALDTPASFKTRMPQDKILEVKCLGELSTDLFMNLKESSSLNLKQQDGKSYIRMNTDNPESLLSDVVDIVKDKARVLSVVVTAPTLEDVFVHLTGVSLDEDETQNAQK
jgi:ABC-2 type transport system ATP-binding protein